MHNINKLICYSFLFIWIFLQSTFLLFNFQLVFHQQKEKKKHATCELYFTIEEWKNIKHIEKDEFDINGNMFDAKSISFQQNKIKLVGHFDKQEDEIKNNHKDIESKKSGIKQVSFFSFLFYEKKLAFDFYKMQASKLNHSIIYKNYLVFHFTNTESPPPKMG